jgi:predicted RNase H-like nuclease
MAPVVTADTRLPETALLNAVGIDGCRAGWVIASRDDQEISLTIIPQLRDLNDLLHPNASVMIDMPIGLTDGPSVRDCDALARQKLRPHRSSSVFGVPARQVTRCTDYSQANALSRELSGKGISKQAFHLFPKIRELDDWLLSRERKGRWSECHPEVAFASLNSGQALRESKKTKAGSQARQKLLAELGEFQPAVERALTAYRRKDVLADDLLDALVCLLTAERKPNDRWHLPEDAPADERGLTMEIVAPALS